MGHSSILLSISNEISLNCSPGLYVFRKHFSCQHHMPPSVSLVSFHLLPAPPVFVLPFHRQDHSITSCLNPDLYPFCRWQKPGLAVIPIAWYLSGRTRKNGGSWKICPQHFLSVSSKEKVSEGTRKIQCEKIKSCGFYCWFMWRW